MPNNIPANVIDDICRILTSLSKDQSSKQVTDWMTVVRNMDIFEGLGFSDALTCFKQKGTLTTQRVDMILYNGALSPAQMVQILRSASDIPQNIPDSEKTLLTTMREEVTQKHDECTASIRSMFTNSGIFANFSVPARTNPPSGGFGHSK